MKGNKNEKTLATLFLLTCLGSSSAYADNALILQTDFSLKDGAVSAMKGVAFGVDHNLKIFDLTHEIPPYNIWEGAYRLYQTASYWPQGSVFVSVVDPGVGTDRKSVVLKTKNGQYFVSPDNGTLTLVAESLGIESVRQIDEKTNRLKGSEKSYTFHGRDVYAYTGARLASRAITFEQVGPELPAKVVELSYQKAKATKGEVKGQYPDSRYSVRQRLEQYQRRVAESGRNQTQRHVVCDHFRRFPAKIRRENAVCRKLRRCAGRPADGVSEQLIECFRGAEYG